MNRAFPALEGWTPTIRSLHLATQILGTLRMLTRAPVENYLELALRILPNGLSSEALPSGGRVELDFAGASVLVIAPDNTSTRIELNNQTQASLLEQILKTLHDQGQALVEPINTMFTPAFLGALRAKHHSLDGSLNITLNEKLVADSTFGSSYAQVLWRAYTATSRWRSRLTGFVTPVVVWAEHFDLSTLWFATEHHDENAPHINFGFAPFDGEHQMPYLYAYAYPMPDGFETLPLPNGASWHTEGWKGMVIPYAELEAAADPEALIEAAFEAVYQTLAPSLR